MTSGEIGDSGAQSGVLARLENGLVMILEGLGHFLITDPILEFGMAEAVEGVLPSRPGEPMIGARRTVSEPPTSSRPLSPRFSGPTVVLRRLRQAALAASYV